MYESVKKLSLLYPDGYENYRLKNHVEDYEILKKDLEIAELLGALNVGRSYNDNFLLILSQITDDYEVIKYRLDILEDLLKSQSVCELLEEIMPMFDELSEFEELDALGDDPIGHINSINELEVFVECVRKINTGFSNIDAEVKSRGLQGLRTIAKDIASSKEFDMLVKELTQVRSGIKKISSVTIGFNLDTQLRPVEAALVSINDQPYKSGDIIDRLLSLDFSKDKYRAISPLVPVVKGRGSDADKQRFVLEQALHASLNIALKSTVKSFTPAIRKYIKEETLLPVKLGPEIAFYLAAVKFINTVRSTGLPMCKPEAAPKEERICKIRGIYNIRLALKMQSKYYGEDLKEHIVQNDIDFDDNGRIFILTGPNQGGKTTYTQTVGLAQYLFQLGLYVPGSFAIMSPVDYIYTHFPVEEKSITNMGRLGEECSRLSSILDKVTRYSLVLLNESLTSTSPGEGAYIAKDILMGLRLSGCRSIFATHFHELGANLSELNSAISGESRIESLVAGVYEGDCSPEKFDEPHKRSYIITQGPPQGVSFAKDIASRYGISIEKIVDRFKERVNNE